MFVSRLEEFLEENDVLDSDFLKNVCLKSKKIYLSLREKYFIA